MRTIGTVVGVAALAVIAMAPTPAPAFGVHIGPFYFGIPYLRHRHRHRHVAHGERPSSASLHHQTASEPSAIAPPPTAGPASRQGTSLLYPALVLPAVYDEIFWPASASAWPFSYDAIFRNAFAKSAADQGANACPAAMRGTVVSARIRREIDARGVQLQLLHRLDGALAMAANYLAKACPTEVPTDPVARLQLMEWQIEKLAEALDMVRPPLQAFEHSLSSSQRARFGASAIDASAASGSAGAVASDCATAPATVDASVERITHSVQPTDGEHDAVTAMRQSFRDAATELDTTCPLSASPSPLRRLEAIQSRLDAAWRAVLAIQVALGNFAKQLDTQQRARLDSTEFASSASAQ